MLWYPRRFPGLPLPAPDTLPWGPAALAPTFEAARELFNAAMPRFKAALSYYLLDGWVTEHVNILMDMSNMYRHVAARGGTWHVARGRGANLVQWLVRWLGPRKRSCTRFNAGGGSSTGTHVPARGAPCSTLSLSASRGPTRRYGTFKSLRGPEIDTPVSGFPVA